MGVKNTRIMGPQSRHFVYFHAKPFLTFSYKTLKLVPFLSVYLICLHPLSLWVPQKQVTEHILCVFISFGRENCGTAAILSYFLWHFRWPGIVGGFFRGIPGGPEHLLCVILSWSFEINMRAHVQDYTNGR